MWSAAFIGPSLAALPGQELNADSNLDDTHPCTRIPRTIGMHH
jgi:hypothetical protein